MTNTRQPPPTRLQVLLAQLAQLESRKFFGDVVLHLSNGQLGPRIDLREVVELSPDNAPKSV